MSTQISSPAVSNYALKTARGRHIRWATQVTFPDGRIVRFTEKMGIHAAIRQAEALLRREAA